MTREKLRGISSHYIREKINRAVELADSVHAIEDELVRVLFEVDSAKLYIRVGFKSLSGFCHFALKLSETQTQRIVTRVRRYEPTPNLGHKRESGQMHSHSP